LIGFTVVYGVLMAADVYLLMKYARTDTGEDGHEVEPEEAAPAATLGLT
jgi:cytochrome bd-type quinol oxidase subunit 1